MLPHSAGNSVKLESGNGRPGTVKSENVKTVHRPVLSEKGHLQRSPENAIQKSISSVRNVREKKPMTPENVGKYKQNWTYEPELLA